MERIANEECITRERVLPGNLIEHVMGLTEAVGFRVKGDELGSKEIVKNCGGKDEAGMKLLGLADKMAVGTMLNEMTI